MPGTRLIVNALGLQIGWWCCVLGASQPWWLVPVVIGLVIHVRRCADPLAEAKAVLRVALAGCFLDAGLGALGVFDFAYGPLPLWLALMWLVLACGFNHSLAGLRRPLWRGVVFGMAGGPLAYLAGARLAGVGLPLGTVTTAALLALVWALWLPLCLRLAAWR